MNATDRPTLLLTTGDPAGVGPQIIARAWSEPRLWACCRPVIVGSPTVMREAFAWVGGDSEVVAHVGPPRQALSAPRSAACVSVAEESAATAPKAATSAASGRASLDAVQVAAHLCRRGEADGLVTLPIDKAAWSLAGAKHPGHTELLAEICEAPSAMMLFLPPDPPVRNSPLGVIHVTLHQALRSVASALESEDIAWKTRLLRDALEGMYGRAPRIGVCALNPHAGEQGLFGDEESRVIGPAIALARQAGVACDGPLPADTLMMRAARGEFEGVVAMYHDQGHIALKMLGVHQPVNITVGLPIIRTSVAHGTAYDLAWRAEAEHEGLLQAVETAARLTRRR